jgi:hypothetical protein
MASCWHRGGRPPQANKYTAPYNGGIPLLRPPGVGLPHRQATKLLAAEAG